MYHNISSAVEFQKWWVLESKLFGQESTYSKVFFFLIYFPKLRPFFDELTILLGFLKNTFLCGMLILGQKCYFVGPTIFKIPQPN